MGSSIEFHGVRLEGAALAGASAAWEPEEVNFVRSVLRPDDRTIVAGGGYGWVAVQVALVVGVENVVVFEPQAHLAQALRYNVRVDGRPLRVLPYALAVGDGEGRLWEHPYWAAASLNRRSEEHGRAHLVRTMGIDQAIRAHAANVLVLDIEGTEWDLVQCMDWSRIRAAVVEVHEKYLRAEGKDPDTVKRYMQGVGLAVVGELARADGSARYVAGVRS